MIGLGAGLLRRALGFGILRDGGANWTPLAIPSLRLWMDAANEAARRGMATTDVVTLDVANDSSKNGFNFSQATAANRISLLHDGTRWVFRGANGKSILRSLIDISASDKGHIHIAFKPSDVATAQYLIASSDEAVTNSFFTVGIANSSFRVWQRSGVGTTEDQSSGSAMIAGSQYLLDVSSDGAAYTVWLNGVLQTLVFAIGANTGDWFSDTPGRDNFSMFSMKRSAEVGYYLGDAYSIIIADLPLSTADRASLARYNNGRYRMGLPFEGAARGGDLLALDGQSNMLGHGDFLLSPPVPVGTAFELDYGFKYLSDPVYDAATGSLIPALSNAYTQATGRKLTIVSGAKNDTAQVAAADAGNGNWDASGTLSAALVAKTQNAVTKLGVNLIGVAQLQGETDAAAIDAATITADDYQNALVAKIARYRAVFGATMPYFIILIGRRLSTDTAGWAAVRARAQAVADADPHTYVVSTLALSLCAAGMMVDDKHMNQTALNQLGTDAGSNIAAIV